MHTATQYVNILRCKESGFSRKVAWRGDPLQKNLLINVEVCRDWDWVALGEQEGHTQDTGDDGHTDDRGQGGGGKTRRAVAVRTGWRDHQTLSTNIKQIKWEERENTKETHAHKKSSHKQKKTRCGCDPDRTSNSTTFSHHLQFSFGILGLDGS